MKKRLFIIAVLAIGMAACLGSCKKKTTEPTTDPTTDPTEEYVCPHDSLVHVMAVEPTAEENGCIEHYKCANCLATFADAQATTPVENTILWATDFVIDDECIAETQFAEYAGDESYLLRACRGNLNEGDLMGWENWTDEQWQAHWEEGREYYIELGGGTEFVLSPISIGGSIFSFFLNKVINKDKLGNIDKNISAFFEDDEQGNPEWEKINGKLDSIMEKLNVIQNDIKALSDKITLAVYQKAMSDRYQKQLELGYVTTPMFRNILNILKANNKSYSNLPQAEKDKIKSIVDEWHSKIIGGTDIETCAYGMTAFGSGSPEFKNLPTVYDYIAYHTIPWEHKAYTYREMTRSVDAVLMAECYLMNILYHYNHDVQTFTMQGGALDMYNQAMESYVLVLASNPINYHKDYFICQIPGAKVNVKKELRQLEPYDYLRGKTIYLCPNPDNPYQAGCVDNFKKAMLPTGSVLQNWYTTVYQYYANRATSQIDDHFLYRTLESIGFKNVPPRTNGDNDTGDWIIADCNRDFWDPDRSISGLYCNKIFEFRSIPFSTGEDWLAFHTIVLKKDGKSRYLWIAHHMTIQYARPMEITNNGTKQPDRNFFAIELYQ